MPRKKKGSYHGPEIFPVSPSNDPITNLLSEAGNVLAGHTLHRLSLDAAKNLGLNGTSQEQQMKLDRSSLSVEKMKLEIAQVQRKEAEALERAENLRLKRQKQELENEKRLRLLDLQIQKREHELERTEQRIAAQNAEYVPNIKVEPIPGALEVCAISDGLSSMAEQVESYMEWIYSLREGKVSLILGKRGSGKTALIAKIGEFLMAVYAIPTYWIGAPETARQLVPNWIRLVDTPENCPPNSFLMCDEAGINYLSLLFNTSENRFIRRLLMIARQKHISLAFATQSARDVDFAIVRQADSIIFKEPGLHQPDSERPDIKAKAKKAALAFKEIPKEERIGAAYVFDDDFEGMIQCRLPSFWTEDLSHIYAQLDLSQIENRPRGGEYLDRSTGNGPMYLGNASLEQSILDLRRQDYGIERIAKSLGCSTWNVRKCLSKYE